MTKSIDIELNQSDLNKLADLSTKHDVSINKIIKIALEQYLTETPTVSTTPSLLAGIIEQIKTLTNDFDLVICFSRKRNSQ